MELLSKTEEHTITSITYSLKDEEKGVIYYTEWLNDGGELVSFTIKDENEGEIGDAKLLDKIWLFLFDTQISDII